MTTPSQTVVFPAAVKKHALEVPYRCLQSACVAVILFVVAAFFRLGSSPYIAFAFAGAFVVHMAMRPSRRELAVVVACAAMFGAAYFLLHADVTSFYGAARGISGRLFFGLGSLLLVTLQWFWAPETEKHIRLERAREVVLIPALCLCSAVAVNLAIGVTPITYDRLLYVFDLKFLNGPGGPPSWVVGRLLRAHPWLLKACGYVYNSLPLGLAACLAIQWRDRQRDARDTFSQVDLRWISVALGVTGFLLYQVSPASGPVYLFAQEFPFHVPDLTGLAIQPAWLQPAARNGMPSLHVGWTLLLFWNIRRLQLVDGSDRGNVPDAHGSGDPRFRRTLPRGSHGGSGIGAGDSGCLHPDECPHAMVRDNGIRSDHHDGLADRVSHWRGPANSRRRRDLVHGFRVRSGAGDCGLAPGTGCKSIV